tara:strand:+ start:4737 stop:5267 length:531 start_codon:yes stop_codon:yes gene_type:complete
MSFIDKKRKFISVNIAVLTISDTRSKITDSSGKLLVKSISEHGHKIIDHEIIPDEIELIKNKILSLSKKNNLDIIITTGGTGLTGRDSTPEAILELSDKIIDGFGELFRYISFNKIGTSTIQSRAMGAIINGKYIFCLPGSTNACKDAWEKILKFQLDNRNTPCNFIEILPRLTEK